MIFRRSSTQIKALTYWTNFYTVQRTACSDSQLKNSSSVSSVRKIFYTTQQWFKFLETFLKWGLKSLNITNTISTEKDRKTTITEIILTLVTGLSEQLETS